AIALLEQAKAGYEKLGAARDAKMCEHWIARCATSLGDLELAMQRHQRVLDATEGPLDQLAAKTADAIGCDLSTNGQYARATNYFRLAALAHEANNDRHWAADSCHKWITRIRAAGLWHQMDEASALMLRVSKDVDQHILAHIGRVLAACAMNDGSVDVDGLLAKCDRLATAGTETYAAHEIQLGHIAVLQMRGDRARARRAAEEGIEAAQASEDPRYQARFLLACAENLPDDERLLSQEMTLTAQDIAEVLSDCELLDRAAMLNLHLRKQPEASSEQCAGDELPFGE
ncbi:MAG: hypothetical protein EB027_05410, partial [Actinobacteria bacterium]|nr:hypothetical protein [Actinomycetota bacterium]